MDPELSKLETWLRMGYPLRENMVLGDWVFRASVEPAEVEGFSRHSTPELHPPSEQLSPLPQPPVKRKS